MATFDSDVRYVFVRLNSFCVGDTAVMSRCRVAELGL